MNSKYYREHQCTCNVYFDVYIFDIKINLSTHGLRNSEMLDMFENVPLLTDTTQLLKLSKDTSLWQQVKMESFWSLGQLIV